METTDMTKEETVKIMAMLGAFYSGGKNDPKIQANAWHLILEKYDYDDAAAAVLKFAENDTRDYATFPAVGRIVAEIRKEAMRKKDLVKEVIHSISYGKAYSDMSDDAKLLINEETYHKWSLINAMDFAANSDRYAEILRRRQTMLLESGRTQ